MIDPIILVIAVLVAGLTGLFTGHALATFRTSAKELPLFVLSDEAIAHIAHEARRAYERSLGIIRLKTWNNLEERERERLTRRITQLRLGSDKVLSNAKHMAHRLELAVIGLVGPKE